MSAKLTELAERRRLLAMEADLHRSLIALQVRNLGASLAGFQSLRGKVAAAKPLWLGGGAIAGLFAMRHWRSLARWMPLAFAVLRWLRARKEH